MGATAIADPAIANRMRNDRRDVYRSSISVVASMSLSVKLGSFHRTHSRRRAREGGR